MAVVSFHIFFSFLFSSSFSIVYLDESLFSMSTSFFIGGEHSYIRMPYLELYTVYIDWGEILPCRGRLAPCRCERHIDPEREWSITKHGNIFDGAVRYIYIYNNANQTTG